MKAIILTAGAGTRLSPVTKAVNKNFLPVYNKPMVYYPLSLVIQAQIREVAFLVDPRSRFLFEGFFGDGSQWGMRFEYVEQPQPRGLAEGLILCESWLAGQPVMYVLGDNILYGSQVPSCLKQARNRVEQEGGAVIFGYPVLDPERFGVVEFDAQGRVLSLEEKPQHPKSHYAVTGIYFLDGQSPGLAKQVEPSARGELEITSVLELYRQQNRLRVQCLGLGMAWFDAGTYDSFLEASQFVAQVERHLGDGIGYVEELVYQNGWISQAQFVQLAESLKNSTYGQYLLRKIRLNSEATIHPTTV